MKLLAILSGIFIAIMVSLNGELSTYYTPFFSIFIFNLVGLIFVVFVVLFKRSNLRKLRNRIPLYFFLPGILGIVLTLFNNISINEIGVSITLALAVVGQLVFSTIIDSFGLMSIRKTPFDKRKIIGFIVIVAGIVCLIKF